MSNDLGCMSMMLWIMSELDTVFDPKLNVGHFDLSFMGQWFCLISLGPLVQKMLWDIESLESNLSTQNNCRSL